MDCLFPHDELQRIALIINELRLVMPSEAGPKVEIDIVATKQLQRIKHILDELSTVKDKPSLLRVLESPRDKSAANVIFPMLAAHLRSIHDSDTDSYLQPLQDFLGNCRSLFTKMMQQKTSPLWQCMDIFQKESWEKFVEIYISNKLDHEERLDKGIEQLPLLMIAIANDFKHVDDLQAAFEVEKVTQQLTNIESILDELSSIADKESMLRAITFLQESEHELDRDVYCTLANSLQHLSEDEMAKCREKLANEVTQLKAILACCREQGLLDWTIVKMFKRECVNVFNRIISITTTNFSSEELHANCFINLSLIKVACVNDWEVVELLAMLEEKCVDSESAWHQEVASDTCQPPPPLTAQFDEPVDPAAAASPSSEMLYACYAASYAVKPAADGSKAALGSLPSTQGVSAAP